MTTPTLSKAQQKKAPSAKKASGKGLKNVLARPDENYWPLLKHDYGAELENLLKRLLPVLKRPEKRIPWSQLRKMNKEERLAARKAAHAECNISYDETIAKSIIFGINATTRSLEKDDTCCILLDATVEPSLLVRHVVIMARNQNIPILLVSFLKKVTLDTIGFASAAITLKNHVKNSAENYFYTLLKIVSELSIQLNKIKTPVTLFQDKSLEEDKINDSEAVTLKMEVDIKDNVKACIISTDVYLYRKSTKERVFQPSISIKSEQETNEKCDFIALDTDKYVPDIKKEPPSRFFGIVNLDNTNSNNGESDKSNVKLKTRTNTYKPLKVKRLKGNELRIKATKLPKVKRK